MSKLLLCALCVLCGLSLPAQVLLRWEVDTNRSAPKILEVYQGETVNFEIAVKESGAAKAFPDTSTAVFLWQTNGMDSSWWSLPASVSGSVVRATWSPSNDVGSASYTWYVAVIDSATINYRINGTLRLRNSPGFAPVALASPAMDPVFAAAVLTVVGVNTVVTNAPTVAPAPTRLYNVMVEETNNVVYAYSYTQRAYIRQPARDLGLWFAWSTTNATYVIDGITNTVSYPAKQLFASPVVAGVVQRAYVTYSSWVSRADVYYAISGSAGTIYLHRRDYYEIP